MGKNENTKTVGSGAMLAAAAAAASSTTAMAADFHGRTDPPMAAPTWQGFYVGGSVGASWLDSSFYAVNGYGSGSPVTANSTGWLGGLQAGYNWQDRNFVWGLEGDISFLAATKTSFSNGSYGASSKINGVATFRARFGFDFDGTMPYLTAGLALGDIKSTYAYTKVGYSGSSTSKNTITPGVVLGGGIEHQFAGTPWSIRGEVLWVGFQDKLSGNLIANGTRAGFSYTSNLGTERFSNDLLMARIGLNYRF
jgi:outer membrane immunogenic protein